MQLDMKLNLKYIQTGGKEVILFLFTENMIVYMEKSADIY